MSILINEKNLNFINKPLDITEGWIFGSDNTSKYQGYLSITGFDNFSDFNPFLGSLYYAMEFEVSNISNITSYNSEGYNKVFWGFDSVPTSFPVLDTRYTSGFSVNKKLSGTFEILTLTFYIKEFKGDVGGVTIDDIDNEYYEQIDLDYQAYKDRKIFLYLYFDLSIGKFKWYINANEMKSRKKGNLDYFISKRGEFYLSQNNIDNYLNFNDNLNTIGTSMTTLKMYNFTVGLSYKTDMDIKNFFIDKNKRLEGDKKISFFFLDENLQNSNSEYKSTYPGVSQVLTLF